MALIRLNQIQNGKNLFNSVSDLTKLLIEGKNPDGTEFSAKYDGATLVGFTYTKEVDASYELKEGETVDEEAEVSKEGNKIVVKTYTVADALQEVKDNIASIMGDGSGVSLTTLDERLKEVETTQISDYRKIEDIAVVPTITCADLDENGKVQYEEGTENVITKSAVVDGKYPLYTKDNLVVYTKTTTTVEGKSVDVYKQAEATVANATATLPEETVYVIDTKTSKTGYAEYDLDDGYKFFVKATLDLFDENNSEFLLDNQEMQLVAQEQAIAELVKRLSEDETLVKEVREMIGETAIKAAIDEATHELKDGQATLDARITANKDHADDNTEDIVALDTRLKEVEQIDSLHKHVLEDAKTFVITEEDTEASTPRSVVATVSDTPVEDTVKMIVNGVVYTKNFTVDAENKTITITDGEAGIGFDLENTDSVVFEYIVEIPSIASDTAYDPTLNATTTTTPAPEEGSQEGV